MSAAKCAGEPNPQARILFVDDDELMRLSSIETLKDLGYSATAAATGAAALDYLRVGGGVDVLITDVGLPDIPGVELAAEVRALRPEVRVIFATGYGKRRAMGASTAPRTSFLAKPFAREALANAISGALEQDDR
jgi:DNA-binding NtrC family response regulator